MNSALAAAFGNIDIYVFDQLLKGTFDNCRTVLDAGCGGGRNIHYFLKNGFEVSGIDMNPNAVATVKQLSANLAPHISLQNFFVSGVEDMPFPDAFFDLVICSAVLHFARDKNHFEEMLHSLWRVLKPGGFLFTRLASDIGIEAMVRPLGNGRYLLPDETERYLVDHETLMYYTEELDGDLFEPIKTTNVNNDRAMTTWCLRKK
jgi:tellurite methyltransferase